MLFLTYVHSVFGHGRHGVPVAGKVNVGLAARPAVGPQVQADPGHRQRGEELEGNIINRLEE